MDDTSVPALSADAPMFVVVRTADDADGEVILQHCIASLAAVFALTSPASMARVQRIARVAVSLASACAAPRPDHIANLVFVSQLGALTLPASIVLKMHRGQNLTENERRTLRETPDLGDELLSRIPGMQDDREIVRLHDVHASGTGVLPLESAIMRVAIGFDRLEAGGKNVVDAVAALRSRHPMYDEAVLVALETSLVDNPRAAVEQEVLIDDVMPRMVLAQDVVGLDGMLRLGAGHELTTVIIDRLRVLAEQRAITPSIMVVGAAET